MSSRNLSFKVPRKCAHYDDEERIVYLWNPRALWRGSVGPQSLCCSKSEGKNQAHRKMLSLYSYDWKLPPLLVQRDLQLTDPSFGAWEGKRFKITSLQSFKLLPPNALLVVMCRDDHWKKQRLTWHKLWGWNVKGAFHWSCVSEKRILDGRQIIWLAGWMRFKVDQIWMKSVKLPDWMRSMRRRLLVRRGILLFQHSSR